MKQFQRQKEGKVFPSLPSKSLRESSLQAVPLLSALLLVRYPFQRGHPATPRVNTPKSRKKLEQNTSFRLFQFAHNTKFYCHLKFPGYYDSAVAVVSMIQFLFACNINIHSFAICFKTWNYALIVMLPTVDFHKIHQCAVCTWNC